jgi:hypothetical protein
MAPDTVGMPASIPGITLDTAAMSANVTRITPDTLVMPANVTRITPDTAVTPTNVTRITPDAAAMPANGVKIEADRAEMPADGATTYLHSRKHDRKVRWLRSQRHWTDRSTHTPQPSGEELAADDDCDRRYTNYVYRFADLAGQERRGVVGNGAAD